MFPWPDDDGPRVASKNAAGTPWEHGENWGVHAKVPAGGVLARILRRVPLHGAIERASFWPLHWTDLLLDREGNRIERQPSPKPPRRGRRPVPDEELLKVAKVYDEAFRGGAKKNPTQAVAARFRNMSPARARDLVFRARRRGFLTEAHHGRAGGGLTKEARTLLKRQQARKKGAKK